MSDLEHNVICPGCGCVCDDVSLAVSSDGLHHFQPECELGERWFRRHAAPCSIPTLSSGKAVDLDVALDDAARLLHNARYPLIYGLSRSATPGQRAAIALGEFLGGVVDTTASLCHGPSIMAIQEVGEVTCTLGETRNRADLVIFWGCDPAKSHPRHAERYSVFAEGRFTKNGRKDRTIVFIGDENLVNNWKLDDSDEKPDLVIPVTSGRDFEAISEMRMILKGHSTRHATPELTKLVELMKTCRYGTVFFGLGLAETSLWESGVNSKTGHVSVAALLQLVAELNAFTRFTARRMRLQGDVSGADNVMCWQTSYPFGVDFSRGYPRYNPGEFTANELLERGDVDACLLIGTETVSGFSEQARQHLAAIPTVVVDYPNVVLPIAPSVQITTAVYGIHAGGTIYRMDNVPMSLRPLTNSDLPTDESVLNSLLTRCQNLQSL